MSALMQTRLWILKYDLQFAVFNFHTVKVINRTDADRIFSLNLPQEVTVSYNRGYLTEELPVNG